MQQLILTPCALPLRHTSGAFIFRFRNPKSELETANFLMDDTSSFEISQRSRADPTTPRVDLTPIILCDTYCLVNPITQ